MTRPISRPDALVRLRGHHLLCLYGFRGLGYSEAFVAQMRQTIARLQRPGATVAIVTGPDELCAACPHRGRTQCASHGMARDAAVLQALGLAPGQVWEAEALFARIIASLTPAQLPALCAGCAWEADGHCREGLGRGRIAALLSGADAG